MKDASRMQFRVDPAFILDELDRLDRVATDTRLALGGMAMCGMGAVVAHVEGNRIAEGLFAGGVLLWSGMLHLGKEIRR